MSDGRHLLIACNMENPDVCEFRPEFERVLNERDGCFSAWHPNEGGVDLSNVDVVVVLGGDGFLMQCIRALGYPEIPFFGVNYGQVGFLMNPRMEPEVVADLVMRGDVSRLTYPVLEAEVDLHDGTTINDRAFNDFVLERASGQTVHLATHIDGVLLNRYSGDGIIISTPGGSSAYSLAAGGPVVHGAVDSIIVTPLYPHRPVQFHSLQFPIVLSLSSEIRIVVEATHKRPVRFVSDGRAIEDVNEVRVAHKGARVSLLREPNYNFIDALVNKIIGQR